MVSLVLCACGSRLKRSAWNNRDAEFDQNGRGEFRHQLDALCGGPGKGLFPQGRSAVRFIVTSSAAALAATHSGAVEFTGFAGSAIGAAMQGLPVKVVLALSKKPKYWIFSEPEIRSLAELSGSTLAVGVRGGGPHIYALIILDKFGLTGKVQVLPLLVDTRFAARIPRALTAKSELSRSSEGNAKD